VKDRPRGWRWGEDGLVVEGAYVRTDEAPSVFGHVPILVLEVGGEERAIWVVHAALRSRLAEELRRRGTSDFEPGERIRVERGADRRVSSSGRSYWPFVVSFPDHPRRSAAEILGAAPPRAARPSPPEEDEVPF
jgi:hypothetical protein